MTDMAVWAAELMELGRREGRREAIEEIAGRLRLRAETYDQLLEKNGVEKKGPALAFSVWTHDMAKELEGLAEGRRD